MVINCDVIPEDFTSIVKHKVIHKWAWGGKSFPNKKFKGVTFLCIQPSFLLNIYIKASAPNYIVIT